MTISSGRSANSRASRSAASVPVLLVGCLDAVNRRGALRLRQMFPASRSAGIPRLRQRWINVEDTPSCFACCRMLTAACRVIMECRVSTKNFFLVHTRGNAGGPPNRAEKFFQKDSLPGGGLGASGMAGSSARSEQGGNSRSCRTDAPDKRGWPGGAAEDAAAQAALNAVTLAGSSGMMAKKALASSCKTGRL